MTDKRDDRDEDPRSVDQGRRLLLGGIMAAGVAGTTGPAKAAGTKRAAIASNTPVSDAELHAHIDTVVVIMSAAELFLADRARHGEAGQAIARCRIG